MNQVVTDRWLWRPLEMNCGSLSNEAHDGLITECRICMRAEGDETFASIVVLIEYFGNVSAASNSIHFRLDRRAPVVVGSIHVRNTLVIHGIDTISVKVI